MVIDADGKKMRLYVDDKALAYGLITNVVDGAESSFCAYMTEKEIWQDLKNIMHKGNKSSLICFQLF